MRFRKSTAFALVSLILPALLAIFFHHSGASELSGEAVEKEEISRVPEYSSASKEKVTILFAGDTHFQWAVGGSESAIESLIKPIAPIFQSADFRIINLETALSTGDTPATNRSHVFNAKPSALVGLRPLKVGAAVLANNHIMDQGAEGLEQTLAAVTAEGMLYAGAGMNSISAAKPTLFTLGGIRFALVAASAIGDERMWSAGKTPGSARASEMVAQVVNVRRQVDIVIAAVHWGVEYNPYPEPDQIQLGRQLIAAGASAVVGHHPHVPQGLEVVRGGVICYSLGNFLFGSANPYQRPNILLKLTFSKKEGAVTDIQLIPITGIYKTQGHTVRALNTNETTEFWPEYYTQSVKINPGMKDRFTILPDGSAQIKP